MRAARAFTDQVLLAEIFDEFGKDALDGVRKYLGEKIEAIGKQAGLGRTTLTATSPSGRRNWRRKLSTARRADRSHRA